MIKTSNSIGLYDRAYSSLNGLNNYNLIGLSIDTFEKEISVIKITTKIIIMETKYSIMVRFLTNVLCEVLA